jgi:hypothetical protein
MAHASSTGPASPPCNLPTITIGRMLEMTTTSRRFKIELVVTGVRNDNLSGEPVPYKAEWQQHLNIVALGQDVMGDQITIEVSNDDAAWMDRIAKQLMRGRTVVIEQPTFSGSK